MKRYFLLLILIIPLFVSAQVEIVTGGTGAAYTLTVPGSFSLRNGIKVTFKAHADNLASPTLNVNGTGPLPIFKEGGSTPLAALDIKNGQVVEVVYDGLRWQMLSPVATAPGTGNIIGTGSSNKVAFFTGTNNIGFNNNFHWDDANNRLGIGTSNPLRRLHIENTGSTLDSLGNIIVYHNSSTSGQALTAISNNTGTFSGSSTYSNVKLAGFSNFSLLGNIDFGVLSTAHNNGSWAGVFTNTNKDSTYIALGGSSASDNFRIFHSTLLNGDAAQFITYNYRGSTVGINTGIRMATNNYSSISSVTVHGIYIAGNNHNSPGNIYGLSSYITGNSGTKRGLDVAVTGSGTNYGIFVSASGGTNNLAIHVPNSGGDVGIGTANPIAKLEVLSNSLVTSLFNNSNSSLADVIRIRGGSNTVTGAKLIEFRRNDGTVIGSVEQASATSVNYFTTSDKRLKNIHGETSKSINDLMKLKIYDYSYKSDSSNKKITGFLAQELFEIFPQAVSKPREGNDNPNENPWMVDYGSLTPLLVKSIQDQQKQIEKQQKIIEELIKRIEILEKNN